MGNRLCKKKTDVVDATIKTNRSPSKFDRIINRLHLKPTSWKSDSHLNQKQANRTNAVENQKTGDNIIRAKPLSKSSDWTEARLEVPSNEDEHIHLRNPQLSLIFDKDNGTPTPPPRKHQSKQNLREKIEKIARNGLQALQGDKKPIEEPLMVKKKINYNCPVCEHDEKTHNRDHHHSHHQSETNKRPSNKDSKRKKNLSVVSLPNYTDLKLSIADQSDESLMDKNSSRLSLQGPAKKLGPSSISTGKLDSYITRCRSFGSLLPQQLRKLKAQKTPQKENVVISDDSFGPLEDWDLGLIEHYNPKDASLPRPRKAPQKSQNDVLSGIEGLIVNEEDIERTQPKPPMRRSESLVKKINKEGSSAARAVNKAAEDACLTPPPSPEPIMKKKGTVSVNEDDQTEHSSLMKILQEFSMKDKKEKNRDVVENGSNLSSLTPSLVEFERNLNSNLTEEFINAERTNSRAVFS